MVEWFIDGAGLTPTHRLPRNLGSTMLDDGPHNGPLATILVQSSVDGLFAIDREMRYTLWNAAMERFAGKSADEVLGKRLFDVFPFLRELGLEVAVAKAFAGETVTSEARPNALPSGEVHYFDRLYMPLRGDHGSVVGMVGIVRDVTSRYKAEEALRASEERLRMAVEASGIGLWSWDIPRDEVTWEDPLCAIFGLPPGAAPKGREAYLAHIHPEDRARAAEVIARGISAGGWDNEHRIIRADGAVRSVLTTGRISNRDGRPVALGSVIDVTERRQREEQVRQAQKLEAVGQLTAGVAHNFNNLLMAMLANMELAVRAAPSELAPMLRDAEHAALRAADLVRQLMTFAGRNRVTAHRVESIGALVERTVAFCRTTVDRRIAIDGTYDATAFASVDASALEQALVNILINARDALLDAAIEGPRITVTVDVVPAGAPELAGRGDEHVRIRIGDNGPGMDSGTIPRIFEPFFTTKDVGKGTGLGLATTHTIVREQHGFITCESAPGCGAAFSIYLRCATAATGWVDPNPALVEGVARGSEMVLIVDDEAQVRNVVERILESVGFQARQAASGQEAIELLSDPQVASEVSVLLLDVSMPGLSGPELRRRLGELAPRARVIYFTGYGFEAVDTQDAVLEKPITMQRLLETIRSVLDRQP
jgi:PAS domain S-box-containing protein